MFRWLESLVDPFRDVSGTPLPASPLAFIAAQLRPLRGVIAFSVGLSLLSASLEVWLIGYAGRLVDTLAATTPERLLPEHGLELAVVALLALLVRPLVKFVREGLSDLVIAPAGTAMIGARAHRHVLRQSVGWFRNDLAGRILTHVRQAAAGATGAIYSVVHTLIYVTVYIVASLVLMLSIDARLVLPLLIWIGLYFALMALVIPRYRRASARYQAAQSELTGALVDTYANIDTIKLMGDSAAEARDSTARFAAQWRAHLGERRIEMTINSSMALLSSMLLVGLTGYAIALWTDGAAPLGIVAIALALSFQITGMAEWLLDAVSNLFGHFGALEESLKTVAQPLALFDAAGARPLRVTGGAIRFVDVRHSYGRGDGGLDGLNLDIAPGEKVGLVGRSGAGKSTLVNLALRFFDPEAGRIEIDGQDIRAVTQDSLRRQIAMVPQDAALLHRSIRDNIALGRAGVDDAGIAEAARRAASDGFIAGLRDSAGRTGYAAHAGERGVTLSGGQRQRIALARAILKNAPILILDEATSALDSEVEATIQDSLYPLMEGRTVIAIAHRLSTLTRMDRIVVLDDGRVAEQGAHADLLAQGGIYAGLWARQAGGFIA